MIPCHVLYTPYQHIIIKGTIKLHFLHIKSTITCLIIEPDSICVLHGKRYCLKPIKMYIFLLTVISFSLFMIFVIWLFKKYMFFSQRLILYLGIAALFDSIPYMMGNIEHGIGCQIQVCQFKDYPYLHSTVCNFTCRIFLSLLVSK